MSIEQPFDPNEHRREAMMDGSGMSNYLAEARSSDDVTTDRTDEPQRTSYQSRKRRPTGHVRDYESDRDHELAEARAAYEPMTAEQRETNRRGIAEIRKAMGDAAIQTIIDSVHEMIPIDPDNVAKSEADRERTITARLRTHFDRRSQ